MKADNVYGGFGESKVREFHDYSPTIRTPKGGGHIPMIVDHGTIKETQDINCIDANYWKGVDNHGQRTMIGSETTLRRLTPTECERLQGFPDDWTKYGADDQIISDTQRYKMCGNAVTTNVITEIIKRL